MIYRSLAGWNERGILVKELEFINTEMKKQHRKICWRVSLFKNSSPSEIQTEILTAHDEVENESLQKLCYEMDQMYIEQEFEIEAEHQDLIIVGGNDGEETVTLELIPENEDQRLPKKPQVQSCITQFFKNKI